MSSVQTSMKQSRGYFVTTATGCVGYTAAAGVGSGGAWVPGAMTVLTGAPATALALQGVVLRDMGKTIVGAAVTSNLLPGTSRVFRKVQILNRTGISLATSVPSNGITGGDNTVVPPYYTCYIELPSAGSSGSTAAGSSLAAPVAYMPGLPVF